MAKFNLEGVALLVLGALEDQTTDAAHRLGAEIGDTLNDKIEESETQIDDAAKPILKAFIDGLREQLDAEEVDGEPDEEA